MVTSCEFIRRQFGQCCEFSFAAEAGKIVKQLLLCAFLSGLFLPVVMGRPRQPLGGGISRTVWTSAFAANLEDLRAEAAHSCP
jgi:hypothetical protein